MGRRREEIAVFVQARIAVARASLAGQREGLLLGDAEAVHEYRVAVRRLRSELRCLRPLLDADAVDGLRDALATLDELVQPVREAQVLRDRLAAVAAQAGMPPPSLAALEDGLPQRVHAARARLREGLTAAEAAIESHALLQADVSALVRPRVHLRRELRRRVRRLRRQLRAAARRASRQASEAELHRLRIRAKQSRYAAEASLDLLGRGAERQAEVARRVQALLGEVQDSTQLLQHLDTMPVTEDVTRVRAMEEAAHVRLRRRWRALRRELLA